MLEQNYWDDYYDINLGDDEDDSEEDSDSQ